MEQILIRSNTINDEEDSFGIRQIAKITKRRGESSFKT